MKFIADENIAVSVVRFLKERGHDVKDVKEESLFGSSDKKIFGIAQKENRIVLTHDKDFLGIVKNNQSDFEGIILIRCKNQSPKNAINSLEKIFEHKIIQKIKNSIFILSEDEVTIIKK
ncbi:hypothetical protein COU57_01900 [Candidatus Pacearchaeota archaeon CG10_big_fil_rev_8_21_14_0_10_32_14]|nr:MAG: hypothetical protein COU57_01900 [Candidatus Pacearchaeota archaeon CG10_big_fil_rev_8_21_14_0_10_32_14]